MSNRVQIDILFPVLGPKSSGCMVHFANQIVPDKERFADMLGISQAFAFEDNDTPRVDFLVQETSCMHEEET